MASPWFILWFGWAWRRIFYKKKKKKSGNQHVSKGLTILAFTYAGCFMIGVEDSYIPWAATVTFAL